MKICIISKLEHAQPHAQALREQGHEVIVTDPRSDPPLSCDVYICRIESVNHQASWDTADLRKQGKTVLFENSKTKILAAVARLQEDMNMSAGNFEGLTIEKKVALAIETIGAFSPRIEYTQHRLEAMKKLGIVQDVDRALKIWKAIKMCNNNSLAHPWTNCLASAEYNAISVYKTTETGRVLVKLLSRKQLDEATQTALARVLGVERRGTAHRFRVTTPDPAVAATVEPQVEAVETPIGRKVAAEAPEVAAAPAQAAPAEPKPVKPNSKADFKEVLQMMNELLLSLNISDIHIVPGTEGPKVQLSQVVVRKVTNVDDLE